MMRSQSWLVCTMMFAMVASAWAQLPSPGSEVRNSVTIRPYPDLFLAPIVEETSSGVTSDYLSRTDGDATATAQGSIDVPYFFRPGAEASSTTTDRRVIATSYADMTTRWRHTHPTLADGSISDMNLTFYYEGRLSVEQLATSPGTGFANAELLVDLQSDVPMGTAALSQGFIQTSANYQILESATPGDYDVFANTFSGSFLLGRADGTFASTPLSGTMNDVLDPDSGEVIGKDVSLSYSVTMPGMVGAEYAMRFYTYASTTVDGRATGTADFMGTGSFSLTDEFGNPLTLTAIPEPATLSLLAMGGLLYIQGRKKA